MCGQAMARPQATTAATPAVPTQTGTPGLRPTTSAVNSVPFSSRPQSASAVNGDRKVQFPPVAAPPLLSNLAAGEMLAPSLLGQRPPAAPDDIETVVRVSPHPVETQPLTPAATEKKAQISPSPVGPQISAAANDRRAAEQRGPVVRAPLGPQSSAASAGDMNGAKKTQPLPSTQPVPSSFAGQTSSPANPERRAQNPLSNSPGAQTQSAVPPSPGKTSGGFERLGTPENAAAKLTPQNTAPKLMTGTQPLPLPTQRRPAAQAASQQRVQPSAPIRVSGPSFLGLNDDPSEEPEKRYDDLYKTNWGGRIFVVFIVLAIAGGLAYMQWRSSHPLQASPFDHTAPAAAAPAANPAANPSASAQQPPAAEAKNTEAKNNEAEAKGDSEATGNTAASAAQPAVNSAAPSQQKTDVGPAAAPAGAQAPNSAPVSHPPVSQSKPASKSAASLGTITEGHEVVSSKSEGDQEQPVRLAESYIQGRGVPRSCDQALGILRTASNQGNARAEIKLGALYATGNCVAMDRVEAYHYFSRAMRSQPNNAWLDQSRSMLWSNMDANERKQAMEVEK